MLCSVLEGTNDGTRRNWRNLRGHCPLQARRPIITMVTPPRAPTAPAPAAILPIVAIGASAGGLEATSRLLDALPADTGMAFIVVQHLDPSHKSLMVELLAQHTRMALSQASDGCPLLANHVYVIPPGRYLSVRAGALHLTTPDTHQGARLPFDYLIKSLAECCGSQTVAIVLSGTGADGSGGLSALKAAGGHVLAQSPDEAEFDGMPRSAMETGLVDQVLLLADMPQALAGFAQKATATAPEASPEPGTDDPSAFLPLEVDEDGLATILTCLKDKTSHDFRQYKQGTIGRRIARRMALLSLRPGDLAGYRDRLSNDADECALLASDLLINVTSFFRDPKVFETLETTIIPELIRKLPTDQPLRIWVAGCSTGEEAYSIAMVCRDAITDARREIKLQIFASDLDPDAIATAREGLYPLDIAESVPPERLARYFTKDPGGYRVVPTLRGHVVFSV